MGVSSRAEWAGFAGGLAAVLAVWVFLHTHTDESSLAQSVQVSEVQQLETESDKPFDREAGGTVKRANTSRTGNADSGGNGTTGVRDSADSIRAGTTGAPGEDNADPVANPSPNNPATSNVQAEQPLVRVYLTKEKRIETVPLETYVRGVIAAEMPAEFEPAALEAQALAARTYIVRRLLLRDVSGVPVPGADVTDTVTHQAYRSLKEMSRLRTEDEQAWRKTEEAAGNTRGTIIAYKGEPIQALYFSTSNGYTENSEDVFPGRIPYLRSVASPWDKQLSPRSSETVKLSLRQFYSKLGVRTLPALASWWSGYPKIQVTEWTQGKRVKTMAVGGKSFTGTEIRDKLGLRSASFSWSVKDGSIAITTFGSGHGVGMSQWGAEGMAKEGSTAEQIVKHYYSDAQLLEVSKLADRL